MNKISRLGIGLFLCTSYPIEKDVVEAESRPNIIIILADDLGYGDLSCYGCKDIRTPNIDKLAEQGVKFTSFYANGPECSPTRAALLAGRYQQRVGGLECAIGAGNVGRYDEAVWLKEKRELGLPDQYCTLPKSMKKAGYTTAIIGKWHLGYELKFRPDKQGFDYSIGSIGYGGDYFYHVEQNPIDVEGLTGAHNLAENGKEIFRDEEYMTKLIGKEAAKWLDRQEDKKPFFLYLPFTSPHDPFQGPDDDKGRPLQGNEWDFRSREKYVEMVETMDEEIGKVLNVLDRKNFKRETIVIFFSDNGGTKMANNGPFSGYKGSVYEGGIRVPCIIRWPGKVNANTISDQATISFDLSYSVLHAADVPTGSLKLDGYDILSHVIDGKADFYRSLFWRRKRAENVCKAVRDGHLKYLAEYEKGELVDEKLFDLEKDPSEKNDLLKTMPEKATVLKQELAQWEKDVEAPRLKDFNK